MIDENIRAQPQAREDDDRLIEATWTDGHKRTYVNLSAALSSERKSWRQKLGLRIALVRYLDVEAPREEAQPPTCQKCGGEIAGWCCQRCPAEFRENDDGALIFDEDATPPAPEAEKLDPAIPAAVKAMLDRFDRAKGKGGYPTANERWAMREFLNALQQEGR